MLFQNQVANEVKMLFERSQGNLGQTFSLEHIANLPEPVKRYFHFALPERHNNISFVSTSFEGFFRLKQTQQWSLIKGEDYYTVNPPGFVWVAAMKTLPLFSVSVRDCYLQDRGKVLVKAYSLFTIASVEGPEIDQGALSRWLASAVVFPDALLPNENLTWKHIDDNSAKLLFSYKGISIDAVIYFGRNGEIIRFVTDRYCSETRSFEKWTAYYKSYEDYDGFKIPTEMGAIWHFDTTNFNYARFRVTAIDFNKIP